MSITPLMPVYPRCGFRPVRGDHCHLIGEDGRRFLDFAAGIAQTATHLATRGAMPAINATSRELLSRQRHGGLSATGRFVFFPLVLRQAGLDEALE